jgi:hypothetical protein
MRKLLVIGSLFLVPTLATADDSLVDNYKLSASFGGGFVGFVDDNTRDFATEGGAWEGRLALGTGSMIAIEAAYLGTLQNIDALGLGDSARLLGTTLEADLRINLLEGDIQPFVLIGAGWTRYDMTNTSANTSDVQDVDNLATMPVGLGLGYRYGDVLFDVRGTYRATTGNNLIDMHGTADATLDTWSATLRVGFQL